MISESPEMSRLALRRTEKRRTQIIALLNGPDKLTDVQIGEIVGCSTKSVQRTRNRIKPVLSEIQDKLEEYRRLMGAELPVAYRVRRLRQFAELYSGKRVAQN